MSFINHTYTVIGNALGNMAPAPPTSPEPLSWESAQGLYSHATFVNVAADGVRKALSEIANAEDARDARAREAARLSVETATQVSPAPAEYVNNVVSMADYRAQKVAHTTVATAERVLSAQEQLEADRLARIRAQVKAEAA